MKNFLEKSWWKTASVLLLVVTIAGGLLIPLGAGITEVHPFIIENLNPLQVTVTGYHTHFTEKDQQVWLRGNGKYFCVTSFKALDDTRLELNLDPQKFAGLDNALDIVVNNQSDGTIALREALNFSTTTDNNNVTELCNPEVDQNKSDRLSFPYREILYESIRNLFFHVPMWFCMLFLLGVSVYHSTRYLSGGNLYHDTVAAAFVNTALLFGILGLITGMMWANYTWGEPWPNDPKLNGAALGILIYFAYVVLRGAISDEIKRGKLSAVYNLFAIVVYVLFIFVIPRLTDSLHPGNGGNPAFVKYDLDNTLRMLFYPAVIGWIGIGVWIAGLNLRIKILEQKQTETL